MAKKTEMTQKKEELQQSLWGDVSSILSWIFFRECIIELSEDCLLCQIIKQFSKRLVRQTLEREHYLLCFVCETFLATLASWFQKEVEDMSPFFVDGMMAVQFSQQFSQQL